MNHKPLVQPPSGAFVGASWASLILGAGGFVVGLWNADSLQRSEKGFYFAVLLLGLYSVVSLQKAVRDRLDGIPVTGIYFGLSWVAVSSALLMLTVGLWNAGLHASEKGFYAMAFALGLFATVAVQKNVRDRLAFERPHGSQPSLDEKTPADTNR